jgi:DNA-binding NtrC family response regulator
MPSVEGTHLLEPSPGALSLPKIRLVVLRGPDRGRALAVEGEQVVVGTAASADLRLTDPTVSRHHVSVRLVDQGILVADLDSTNGTRVARRRVREIFVEPGDDLQLGATRGRIERQRGRVHAALVDGERLGPLLGRSVAARRLFALLQQLAASEVSVLFLGESGVGKDLAAQALHEHGPRAKGPFVVFDCAAAAPNVIESELFGHDRGAFTGATERRLGAFQEASGGTLFLDEIGELPRELQPKLLRALDRREVKPLGADRAIGVDIRVLSATNRDLKLDVNRGSFREDLYHRVSGFPVLIPPLRERAEDIPLLADHFWRGLTGDEGGMPTELVTELTAHSWPGNVRELRNRVEQLVVLQELDAPPRKPRPATSYREAKLHAVDAFEVGFLTDLMKRAEGNVSEAARLAQMDRVHLSKLLRKHAVPRR